MDLKVGVQTSTPCPNLVFLPDGLTKCKVYNRNRVGRNIGMGNKCILREDSPFNYPGCPLNQDGKPMVERVDS